MLASVVDRASGATSAHPKVFYRATGTGGTRKQQNQQRQASTTVQWPTNAASRLNLRPMISPSIPYRAKNSPRDNLGRS
jgi:hypothetical protein